MHKKIDQESRSRTYNESLRRQSEQILLTCPQCGRSNRGSYPAICRSCDAELLPRNEALCEMYADESALRVCLNFTTELQQKPGLTHLQDFSLDMYQFRGVAVGKHLSFLQQYNTLDETTLDALEKDIIHNMERQAAFLTALLSIPDEQWHVMTNDTKTYCTVFFAHPSSRFTAVTLEKEKWGHETFYRLIVKRFKELPNSDAELLRILEHYRQDDKVESEDKTNIDFTKVRNFSDKSKKEKYGRTIEKFYDQQLLIQEVRDKLNRIESNANSKPLFDTAQQKDTTQFNVLIKTFLDNDTENASHSLSCSMCGATTPSSNLSRSFVRCPKCRRINDLIRDQEVSPELIEARTPKETTIPADYFLQLLSEISSDEDVISDFEKILNSPKPSLENRQKFAKLLSKIILANPHLLIFKDVPEKSSGVAVLPISFPDLSTINNGLQMREDGYRSISIPDALRGKTVFFTFGEFQDEGVKNINNRWCKVRSAAFDTASVSDITEEKWQSEFRPRYSRSEIPESNWLLASTTVVHDSFSEPDEGLTYRNIKDSMRKIPPYNRLQF